MADNGNLTARTMELLHPEVWTLSVHLQESCMKYAFHSQVEDNSLNFGTIEFEDTSGSYVKDVEAAVYDNPVFLSPFGRMAFLIDSDRFLLVPDEMSGGMPEECRKYYSFLYPGDKRNVLVDHIGNAGLSIAYGITPELDSFLRRTFDNPPLMHSLSPIVRFFKQKDAYGGRNKMYVFFNNGKIEITALRSSKVIFANSFKADNPEDAFYFTMNAWTQCGMDAVQDEMYVVGDKDIKMQLLPQFREYIKKVVQVIFPAELLRLGKDAMNAPFDLIILPLCE